MMPDDPRWPALIAAARRLAPELPAWVWDVVPTTCPLLTVEPTGELVAGIARVVVKHGAAPDTPAAPIRRPSQS